MRAFLLLVLLSLGTIVFAQDTPRGFLWYNKPETKNEPTSSPQIPFTALSYTDRDKVLHYLTMEALHKAHQTKKMEDMKRYLALQHYWIKESDDFSQLYQKAMLYSPQYDASVRLPTSNLAVKARDELKAIKHQQIIDRLRQNHGLLFFYKGRDLLNLKEVPVVMDFAERHKLTLIPISVDGVLAPNLPHSKKDHGQASQLGIAFFPALILVNPKSHKTWPLSYGLVTQDVIEERIIKVVTNFKGDGL